jgi:RNA 3'-terminal phosphate cyclase (ATP)
MIEIDGSMGEGGGQVLRSALSLSILTRQPFYIYNIRLGRKKPGLKAQHLKAVDAAAAISHAAVEGARLDSTTLTFVPGELRTGRYKFEIGTAGSTSLVLQTIFLPLSLAGSASTVMITGGTHVPWAPCYHYLEWQWLPVMRYLGFDASLSLEEAGFYPQGGGRISATIRPAHTISPLHIPERIGVVTIRGISAFANLDPGIAERQKRQALRRLQPAFPQTRIKTLQLPARTIGTLLLLQAKYAGAEPVMPAQGCYYALGERGKPAEQVANEALDAILEYIESDATLDQYLADQLLLPLAFARGPSHFCTPRVSQHLLTNAEVIRVFISTHISIEGELGKPGSVRVTPAVESPFNRHELD